MGKKSLLTINPSLASEWHLTKNQELNPAEISAGSDKKVWWQCPKHREHEWQARVADRNKGRGCPFCSGNRVSSSNSLAALNPEVAKQWHPTKNGSLTPDDVTAVSGKKAWWKCPKGDDHEWEGVISNRSKGGGCPICSNQKLARSNSLGATNPDLASQWHPTKNGDLTPFDVLPSTNRKIWWQCSVDPNHEWEATLNNRSNGKGCPVCTNQLLVRENSLGAVNPKLAEQWHPTKNGALTPFDVAPSTNRRVWWKCPRGDDHEWEATVNHRSAGTGCPKCNPTWSIAELRIFCELKSIFPSTQHRAIIEGHEVDIYIPEIKVGVEYDGVYWHHNKVEKDMEKSRLLESTILLIRVREEGLPQVSPFDIRVDKGELTISTIKQILSTILEKVTVPSETRITVEGYFDSQEWVASELFKKIYSERKTVQYEKSLSHLLPELVDQWHPTKNDGLLPEQFSPGSGRKVWWLGECGHEWQDTINHRSRGRDCPKCRYRKASTTWKKNRSKGQLKLFD